ncbi:MAG: hypothetical protein ACQEQG_09200 [Bacillota bacterium]
MQGYKIIDTYPYFFEFWQSAVRESPGLQVEKWRTDYISRWPEVKSWHLDTFEEDEDWREDAKTELFPWIKENISAVMSTRTSLLGSIRAVYEHRYQSFKDRKQLIFVISIGAGKDYAALSTYEGNPAIYFNLARIARNNWRSRDALNQLVALQLGYYYFQRRRKKYFIEAGNGPYWQLYKVGFAQLFSHSIQNETTWLQELRQPGWQDWVKDNLEKLAGDFLDKAAEDYARKLFSPLQKLEGWHEPGFYLGEQVLKQIQEKYNLQQLSLLPPTKIEKEVKSALKSLK